MQKRRYAWWHHFFLSWQRAVLCLVVIVGVWIVISQVTEGSGGLVPDAEPSSESLPSEALKPSDGFTSVTIPDDPPSPPAEATFNEDTVSGDDAEAKAHEAAREFLLAASAPEGTLRSDRLAAVAIPDVAEQFGKSPSMRWQDSSPLELVSLSAGEAEFSSPLEMNGQVNVTLSPEVEGWRVAGVRISTVAPESAPS